uniref:Calmodulin regulated spectrin-associated protein 1a n=1 Tax=Scleropages formosus TaxID=113540 RepID=A0A8C9VDF8_SCLFO
MDADAAAAGATALPAGGRRKTESLRGEGAVDVVPLELYDSARAKIDANLRWLFAKAYGIDHIPEDLRDPFYTDQYEQEHIKPPVIRLLLSSELYCSVCGLILKGDQVASLQSHQAVVQALSRKGIYVMESDDSPVSEADLACTPIKMSAHIAMIDALMMAYTVEMISIEKVVASVKRFSTFSASKELPFDLEDAMVFWINKVNLKLREITEKELKLKQHLLESPSHQKVRYRRDHLSGRQLPYFPLLEDLMKDVCDGAALLAVVHYYCPDHMKLDDICLKEVTSIADSLYNIQLLKEFANEYLNKGFYLTIEDMLYAPLVLKQNVMVFIAELFWWFEVVRPDFVQPRDLQEIKDGEALSLPISNATKRSFLVTPGSGDTMASVQSPDISDMDEEEQDPELTPAWQKALGEGEESLKLQEDMKVREHEDKDGGSGRSSPCLSTTSQASSVASGSVRMTSFAERKLQKAGTHDGRSSTSSSQKTTPDGSESCPLSLTTWRMRREQSPTLAGKDGASVLASELVQLHMQLEEKRRAIEMQKKKMESLSARQRLKLGKAAFLNIVKKGKSDTLPQPLKSDHYSKEEQKLNGEKESSSKDDSCVDALRGRAKDREGQEGKAAVRWNMDSPPSPCSLEMDNKANGALLLDDGAPEPDLNECNRSIEMLNEAINAIQQQMMQLSLQQDLLMKQNIQSPPSAPHSPSPVSAPDSVSASPFANGKNNGPEPKIRPAVHFVEPISTSGSSVVRRPPKLSSSRGPRSKPIDLKLSKENGKPVSRVITPTQSVETLPHLRQFPGGRIPKGDTEDSSSQSVPPAEAVSTLERGNFRSTTFRLHDEANQRTVVPKETSSITQEPSLEEYVSSTPKELNTSESSSKENMSCEEVSKSKAHLIEVDLSDLKDPSEEGGSDIQDITADATDGEQKSVLGFFFKDEQKAEDELAKKRAAFLLKQQRKAEEARLRKQQLEVESELKRDEARRKAEEDRIRKEEEKARRELIKQEYLRRKQQEMIEEQGLSKPKTKPKKQRPKSVHRAESSSDTHSKCSSTRKCLPPSGSSLSLASAATTEAESIHSGGTGSQRGESVESFPVLSRNASRNTERDWENASTASSITSVAEYSGPKLFKEPSAKSNKPIIHNAIAHCCLAGKVNEPQKNSILEELEKCESNHLMILFRDGGCQFRALYSFFPDTEEIHKLTGTGPKSISKKMIDKLYKYSSDRKQFTVIPAKTVSVSVDALTIHNHLWQVKRPATQYLLLP